MSHVVVFQAPLTDASWWYGSSADQKITMAQKMLSDQYEKVGELELPQIGDRAAEEMFDLTNNPEREGERLEKWGNRRSVSVGDVVQVDDVSFLCCSIGWTQL